LVNSIPVSIDRKDSVLGVAIKGFITDTQKAMGYRFIAHEERDVIYKKYFAGMFGGTDAARGKEIAEQLQNDKDYVVKQMERASPLEQKIPLFPVDFL
jgi:hypothetical protein